MREEDLDWKIYHILVANEKCTISSLIDMSGTDEEAVLKSLNRLENNCLIKKKEDIAQILSLQETIMRNSVRSAVVDADSPIIIENGVIKENPNYKGKF